MNEIDILKYISDLGIPYFRGIFMRDRLPRTPLKRECGIINLDSHDGIGSHWTAYCKDDANTFYFDSFGNLRPPKEFIDYLGSDSKIYYNYNSYQKYGTTNCGQLCIEFLYNFYNKE